ncbi:Uncharacterised protein [uncultured archaeon]|nr:Uncharacterised protein [uncultured archaeon]
MAGPGLKTLPANFLVLYTQTPNGSFPQSGLFGSCRPSNLICFPDSGCRASRQAEPGFYLKQLMELKAYSDDLPEQAAGPSHPAFPCMKCRHNTQQVLKLVLGELIVKDLIEDERVLSATGRFLNHSFGLVTTPEDIRLINKTLDTVIQYLCTAYGLRIEPVDLKALVAEARADMGISLQ